MIKRLFSMLYNQTSGINEAAFLLGFFTLLSQILGLVRDRIFAGNIGPGIILDTYYASFKIPDFLYISLASLASVTVILPMLLKKYKDGSNPDDRVSAQHFFNQLFTVFSITLIVVSGILFFAMPWIIKVIVPGFSPNALSQVVILSRIMLLSPIIFGISTMIGSITQMFQKFFVFALAPIAYNIGIIVGVLLFYPIWGSKGLAFGVIFGASLHLLIQLPLLIRESFIPRFVFKISWSEIRSVVQTSLPRTLGLSLSSFTLIVITAIISQFSTGTMSIFTFALNMQSVPIGVIGISYSVASFPVLVRFFQNNDLEKFTESIIQTIRKIIFWSLPIMVLFIVLRAQIVRVLLGGQLFSWNDTRLTAGVLALLVIGITAQCIIHVLVRAYYAAGNTKKPLTANILGEITKIIVLFILLSLFYKIPLIQYFFESVLRLSGVPETRLTMVALAISIGNIINMKLLATLFIKDFSRFFSKQTIQQLFRTIRDTVLSSITIGVVSYFLLQYVVFFVDQNRLWGIFLQGFISGMIGIFAGIIVLKILKNPDITELSSAISRKIWKVTVVQDSIGTGVGN